VGGFENESTWMPWFIDSCDESWRPGAPGTPNMKRKASELVADGQLFCAIDPREKELGHNVERLGEHPWLFSTDYPHSPTAWPDGVSLLAERTDLSESAKLKMFGENALRFCPRLAKR
jgi:predicted TIM-barrel fold metal-dependent hydrolase